MGDELATQGGGSTAVRKARAIVVYADFSCPLCYLASQRVGILGGCAGAHAEAGVEWRAVERCPDLPVTGRRHDADARAAAQRALDDARELLAPGEHLPATVPATLPKTQAAVSALTEAQGAGVVGAVRSLLFSAYWEHSADIGNPEVLRTLLASTFMRGHSASDPIREFGYAVAMTREPITTEAWRLIRRWRQDWQEHGCPPLPFLWDGTRGWSGSRAVRRLADEVAALPRPVGLPDGVRPGAGWLPPTTVVPPTTWVTQVGDPWARALRMTH